MFFISISHANHKTSKSVRGLVSGVRPPWSHMAKKKPSASKPCILYILMQSSTYPGIGQHKVFRHMERIRINESEQAKMFCEIDQPIRHRLSRPFRIIPIDICRHCSLLKVHILARNLMLFRRCNHMSWLCADKRKTFFHCAHS